MSKHEISTAKSSEYIEYLQSVDSGLIHTIDPATADQYAVDDEVVLTTSDEESFHGCYIYQVSAIDAKIWIGVS